MTAHILGTYTFPVNPDTMTMPEFEKVVSEVKTYYGSALFQWEEQIEGKQITLTWKVMSATMYDSLRALQLLTSELLWNPQYLGTYQVIVTSLSGEYIEYSLDELAYRENVILQLNIRSFTAT